LPERFERQLRRSGGIDRDSLRLEEQFDCLKDVRLIVGDQYTNFFLLTRNGSPPQSLTLGPRLKICNWLVLRQT